MREQTRRIKIYTGRRSWNSIAAIVAMLCLVISACGGAGGTSDPSAPGDSENDGDELTATTIEASSSTEGGSAPVDDIATYQGQDRQQLLEEGAANEGELTVYSKTTEQAFVPVVEAFEEKYPFIEVSVFQATTSDLISRYIEEGRSGVFNADVIEADANGVSLFLDDELVRPFWSPELEAYPDASLEPSGYTAPTREAARGIAFNTDLVDPAEAPESWQDLLDPAYAGMIAVPGGNYAPHFAGFLEEAMGLDYLASLAEQELLIVGGANPRTVADMVASGEVAISPFIIDAHAQGLEADGAPVQWVLPDPADFVTTNIALPAEPTNPHAAMLFIDFILSSEGQAHYTDQGFLSVREDMVAENLPDVTKIYLDSQPDPLGRDQHYQDLAAEYFE